MSRALASEGRAARGVRIARAARTTRAERPASPPRCVPSCVPAAVVALALVSLAGPFAGTAQAQELARLFPEEADVYTTGPGLARLPLPASVLETCAPDLGDLRLFDDAGHEVPFLVDPGVPLGARLEEEQSVEGRVLDLVREEIPREDRKPLVREVYRVTFPGGPVSGDAWTLVVRSERPRFVRSANVEGAGVGGEPVVLVARTSLVRLGQPTVDRTEIPLPRFDGNEIRLTIEGEEGFFLEPTFHYRSRRAFAAGDTLEIDLPVRARHEEPGRTVVEVARPPGLVPTRLRLATSTAALDRPVRAFDVAPSGVARSIAEGRLVRAPGVAGEADGLELDVGVATGERLRLEILDRDSPPLADLTVSALVRQPALIFALPAAAGPVAAPMPSAVADVLPAAPGEAERGLAAPVAAAPGATAAPAATPAGVLRFGGGRAWRPRYDVADLFRDALLVSGERLADPSVLPLAVLGPPRPNPAFDAGPALAAVMRAGASVEPRQWRWRRPIVVPASPEGLVRLRLAPQDAAQARADYADLRVIDAAGRQWPYVAAPAVARQPIALRVQGPITSQGVSRWTLVPPAAPLPIDRLVIVPVRPVLGRPYRLVVRDQQGAERVLARGVLAQDLRRPTPIEIAFPAERVEQLELVIEDGDDAPTELDLVETRLALPELLLAAPQGDYTLLAGNPDASAPQYEIGRARDTVAGLRSADAAAGVGEENPDWSGTPGGAARARERLQATLVWAAIALAVLVLGALTLRVARGETAKREG